MNIKVHIERLILEGMPLHGHDGPRVRAAVTAELQRLIGAHGISDQLRQSGAVPQMRAGALRLARENSPAKLGQGIAGAVHEGIGNAKKGAGPQ